MAISSVTSFNSLPRAWALSERANGFSAKGFSLLELMMVILIIGIASSLVRIAVTDKDPLEPIQETAAGFNYWFGQQLDFALLNSTEVGLYFTDSSIHILEWEDGNVDEGEDEVIWTSSQEFNLLQKTDYLKHELILDVVQSNWQELTEFPDDPAGIEPHIIIFPSEEYFPSFILKMHMEDYSDKYINILADGFNRPELSREES